jgi:hypothetical protein
LYTTDVDVVTAKGTCDQRALETSSLKEGTPIESDEDDERDDKAWEEVVTTKKRGRKASGKIPSGSKLSNYKIQREENIARNNEMLQAFDATLVEKYGSQVGITTKKPEENVKEKKPRTKKSKSTNQEVRRSQRNHV